MHTTKEVAQILDISEATVRLRARKLKIGKMLHSRAAYYTQEDIDMIENYKDQRYRRNW